MSVSPPDTTAAMGQQQPRTKTEPSFVNTMTEEEVENMIENFAMEDQPSNKTWTRFIVEKFLMNVRQFSLFSSARASITNE